MGELPARPLTVDPRQAWSSVAVIAAFYYLLIAAGSILFVQDGEAPLGWAAVLVLPAPMALAILSPLGWGFLFGDASLSRRIGAGAAVLLVALLGATALTAYAFSEWWWSDVGPSVPWEWLVVSLLLPGLYVLHFLTGFAVGRIWVLPLAGAPVAAAFRVEHVNDCTASNCWRFLSAGSIMLAIAVGAPLILLGVLARARLDPADRRARLRRPDAGYWRAFLRWLGYRNL